MEFRQVKIVDGSIRCDECGEPADTIHLTPNVVEYADDGTRLPVVPLAACPKHDPGGYWFEIERLRTEFVEWVLHLAEKGGDSDDAHPLVALLRWLSYEGVTSVAGATKWEHVGQKLVRKSGPRSG